MESLWNTLGALLVRLHYHGERLKYRALQLSDVIDKLR
jgi:hypothetical protein